MPEFLQQMLHDPVKIGLVLSGMFLLYLVLRDPRPLRLGLFVVAGGIGWWVTGLLKITWRVDGWEVAQPVGAGIGIVIVLALVTLLDV